MKSLRIPNKTEVTTVLGDFEKFDPVRNAVNPEAYDEYRKLWDETSKF